MNGKTQHGSIYVSIRDDNTVVVIENLGEYDNIIRRQFDTEGEAISYYVAQGGKVNEER